MKRFIKNRKAEIITVVVLILVISAVIFYFTSKDKVKEEDKLPEEEVKITKKREESKKLKEKTFGIVPENGNFVEIDDRFEDEAPITNDMDKVIETLKEMAKKSELAKYIYENREKYPEPLLILAANRVDSHTFVYNYGNEKYIKEPSTEETYKLGGKFPLYLQWDPRWGYHKYPEDLLCTIGCGPTTLSMFLNGYGYEYNPLKMMEELRANGRYVIDAGTSWQGVIDTLRDKGFEVETVPLVEKKFIDHLKSGGQIIINVGPGYFTNGGHYLLLHSLDEDGKIRLNDSHSIRNSKRAWDFDELKKYIKAAWTIRKK